MKYLIIYAWKGEPPAVTPRLYETKPDAVGRAKVYVAAGMEAWVLPISEADQVKT